MAQLGMVTVSASSFAKAFKLVAEMEAIKVRVLGMEAFNRFHVMQGYSEGYGQEEFSSVEGELVEIARKLGELCE